MFSSKIVATFCDFCNPNYFYLKWEPFNMADKKQSKKVVKSSKTNKIKVPKGMKLIFRPYRKNPKTNQVEYARNYGKRVFPMLVPDTNG